MHFMHSYRMIAHPGLRAGVLADNPFQEQVGRVARAAGLDFMLNVVIDRSRRLLGVFAGSFPQAHHLGCALAASHTVVSVDEPFDLVITSGGAIPWTKPCTRPPRACWRPGASSGPAARCCG